MPYRPQFADVVIDPETTPYEDVRRIMQERTAGYSRDIMQGAEGPYATQQECQAVLSLMCGGSAVRVPNDGGRCHVIDRQRTLDHWYPSCRHCHSGLKYDPALKTCPYCGKPASTAIPCDTDRGWAEVPRHAVAELIRLGYLKRFQEAREFDRIGWREMGWDGDVAGWYGWPA